MLIPDLKIKARAGELFAPARESIIAAKQQLSAPDAPGE